ncbi:hypothetical protein ACIOZL_42375 [Streptomyces sp. NPDC087769]|uniref:hypothetical protein n=1 Tax=Streptomyces sp. NPDC087769 TaxID=3365802 RepID=UPI00381283B1
MDAAFDAAGKGSLSALVELTGSPERVVAIADHRAAEHGVRFVFAGPDAIRERLEQAAALVESGGLGLSVARTSRCPRRPMLTGRARAAVYAAS